LNSLFKNIPSGNPGEVDLPQALKIFSCIAVQGCQMVYFQTKNRNLGTFRRVLQCEMLVYFTATWSILRTFDLVYGHLLYFVAILVHFSPVLVSLCQEKSGIPVPAHFQLARKQWNR
jgi:hypothetical protein